MALNLLEAPAARRARVGPRPRRLIISSPLVLLVSRVVVTLAKSLLPDNIRGQYQ